jgi:hypothetical protein
MYSDDSDKDFTITIGNLKEPASRFKEQMVNSTFFDYQKSKVSIPLLPLVVLGAVGAGAVSGGMLSPLIATALVGGSVFGYSSTRDDFRKHQIANLLAYVSGHAAWSEKEWSTLCQSFKGTVTEHNLSAVQAIKLGRALYSDLGELQGKHSAYRVVKTLQQAFEDIGITMDPMNMTVFQSSRWNHPPSEANSSFSP